MPLTPGELLENRYKIIAPLGEGGFGTVYHALDTRLNAEYAIKELTQTSQEAVEQFRIEAEMMARLKHPSLPSVTDYFSEGGSNYLAMEYVPGLDLAQWLHQKGPVPEKQLLNWATHILDALNYLHTQSPPIIHRDIKPSNIKLGENNRAILVDFGIAKVWVQGGKTTGTAQAVSPPYSPLEQYSSGQGGTDPRSDIYALGATMYLLLSGQHPPDPIQRSTGEQALLPLRQVNPAISAGVAGVVEKAMAMKREDRWQSAYSMWHALARAASQSQPLAKPAAARSKAATFGGADLKKIAAVIVALALILLAFAGFNLLSSTKNAPASHQAALKPLATATRTSAAPLAAKSAAPTKTAARHRLPTDTPLPLPASPAKKQAATKAPLQASSTPPPTRAATSTKTPTRRPPTDTPLPPPATATPVPPTPTARVIAATQAPSAAPILLSPAENASVAGLTAFSWEWNGAPLPDKQSFEVRVWKEGQDHYGATGPGKETSQSIDLNGAYGVQLGGSGNYFWTVAVVEMDPYQRIGAEAPPRPIIIAAAGGGDDDGGGGGGGGKPTPAP